MNEHTAGRRSLTGILFWGSVWGFTEATLGYVLHLLPGMISGALMFPVGLYCMTRAAREGKAGDVFGLALVAALVKSVNLFFPVLAPVSTIHPMIAIMLQSLAGYAFVRGQARTVSPVFLVPACVIGWRLLFIGVQAISAMSRDIDVTGFFSTALPKMAMGSLIDLAVIALWLAVATRLAARNEAPPPVIRPGLAGLSLVLALGTQSLITVLG